MYGNDALGKQAPREKQRMTIDELYGKVLADDKLKASLTEAAKAGKIEEWVAAHGVEATEGELLTYVRAIATKSGELTDEQLDKIAGGGYGSITLTVCKDRADLVAPFLAAVGEAHRLSAWEAFLSRLPQGWETSYVGLFPACPGGLLRVNAHPAKTGAASLEEAIATLGLKADKAARDLCEELLNAGCPGFDLQLDVDDDSIPQRDFGFEAYLEGWPKAASTSKRELARRVFGALGSADVADERWHLCEDLDLSKHIPLPCDGRIASCQISLRLFSAKVKFANGKPRLGKAYLRGDALLSLFPIEACP